MRTTDFKKFVDEAKDNVKKAQKNVLAVVHRLMITRMVADNVADIIVPFGWELKKTFSLCVHYEPAAGSNITITDLDKLAAKLSKVFNTEPYKNLSRDVVDFTFYLHPRLGGDWQVCGTRIEFVIGNTEACEVETIDVVRQETQLTGYCKALSDKKYLHEKV